MVNPAELLREALDSGSPVALPVAILGGLVMGLNPCCLALYPAAAASCCTGGCDTPRERTPLSKAVLFMLGTATATTVLGVMAALAGHMMTNLGGWVRYLVALVPLVMGAHVLGVFRLPMPKALQGRKRQGLVGAYVGGLLLSLVIGPCGTPALAAILSYAAYKGSIVYGGLLLFAYGCGNGLPLLLVGLTAGGLAARLRDAVWLRWVERGSGGVLVALGAYLLWTA